MNKICDKCGGLMLLDPYFNGYVCAKCGFIEKENNIKQELFNIEKVLEQLEDYGKYKGILRVENGVECENYIPVSMAKQIVKGRGLGGFLGYMEEVNE